MKRLNLGHREVLSPAGPHNFTNRKDNIQFDFLKLCSKNKFRRHTIRHIKYNGDIKQKQERTNKNMY